MIIQRCVSGSAFVSRVGERYYMKSEGKLVAISLDEYMRQG